MEYDYTQGPFYISPDKNPIHRRAERKNLSRLFFGLVFYLLVSSFAGAALSVVLPHFLPEQTALLLAQIIPSYCIAFPLCCLMVSGCPKKRPEKQKFSFEEKIIFLAISYTAIYGGNLIGVSLSGIFSALMGGETESLVGSMMEGMSPLVLLVLVVILAPIFEEWLFRKVLMERLLPYSERLAVFLTALLFGLLHGNTQQFFYAFLVGCVFGYVYVKTGRLRYTILMHMILNFIGSFVPLLFQRQSETAAALSASINPWDLVLMIFSAALMLLCVLGLILFFLNLKRFKLSKEGDRSLSLKSQFQLSFGNAGMILFLILSGISFIANIFTYY